MKKMLLSLATIVFSTSATIADVRVDIYRDLPEGQRIVVQEFDDQDAFEMWMATRLEEGCLPGVKKVEINLDYTPVWKEK